MAGVGIYFNYKKGQPRSWLYCTVAMMVTIILIIVTYYTWTSYELNPSVDVMLDYSAYFLQTCSLVQITISFLILLCGLRERFAVLNAFLRCFIAFFFKFDPKN